MPLIFTPLFSTRPFIKWLSVHFKAPDVIDIRPKGLAQDIQGRLRRVIPAGRIGHRLPTNPSPSAYGEWPGRINRKAGISFRRCGSAVPRLAVAVSFELRRCQWQLCSRATYWTHVQSRSFIPTYLALLLFFSFSLPPSLSSSASLSLFVLSPNRPPSLSAHCPSVPLLSSFSPFSYSVPSISISSLRLISRPEAPPQPTSQIIVHVMGHAHRIEPTGNNKVEGGLSRPIYSD